MKKTNKGFSMVELIIVIAIMAILAGALAPALIKYINKSRLSTDIQTGQTIATAIQTALSNEDAFDDAPSGSSLSFATLSAAGSFGPEFTSAMGTAVAPKGKAKKSLSGDTHLQVTTGNTGGADDFLINLDAVGNTVAVYRKATSGGTKSVDLQLYPTVDPDMGSK